MIRVIKIIRATKILRLLHEHKNNTEKKERETIEFKLNEQKIVSVMRDSIPIKMPAKRKLSINPLIPRIKRQSILFTGKTNFGVIDANTVNNSGAMEKLLMLQKQLNVFDKGINDNFSEKNNDLIQNTEVKLEKEDILSIESSINNTQNENFHLNEDRKLIEEQNKYEKKEDIIESKSIIENKMKSKQI